MKTLKKVILTILTIFLSGALASGIITLVVRYPDQTVSCILILMGIAITAHIFMAVYEQIDKWIDNK